MKDVCHAYLSVYYGLRGKKRIIIFEVQCTNCLEQFGLNTFLLLLSMKAWTSRQRGIVFGSVKQVNLYKRLRKCCIWFSKPALFNADDSLLNVRCDVCPQTVADVEGFLKYLDKAENDINTAEPISVDPETLRVQLRDHNVSN